MNAPGLLPVAPRIEPLRRISPSRYSSLCECILREAWAACWRPPLLPTAPAARLGGVIHALLEAAGKGELEVGSTAIIKERWEVLLRTAEQAMAESWTERPLQPLRLTIPDFEVRRLRAFERAAAIARAAEACRQMPSGDRGVGNELWVASADGMVGGYIDSAVELGDELIIRDYKTGPLMEAIGTDTVKPSYENQLKLYAALYHSSFNRWPTRLELIPLRGDSIALSFTREECLSLLRDATDLLNRTNDRIEKLALAGEPLQVATGLATPAPTACRYCPYRPACPAYREARKVPTVEKWPADVVGELEEIRTLGNGRLSLSITDSGLAPLANVRGIDPDPDRHPALLFLAAGQEVAVCNLRSRGSPRAFSEATATVLYVTRREGS